MGTIHLVAVQHDNYGNLLSPNMYPLIQNHVIPLMTQDCVVVVEGGKNRGKLKSDSPDYNILYSQLGPICLSGLRPVIHFDDPMFRPGVDILQHLKEIDSYTDTILRVVSFRRKPDTWEELISIVRTNQHDVKMIEVLPERWKVFAKELKEEFVQRDDAYIDQIKNYAKEDKTVLFIGGLLHCISLNVREEWSVIRYPCARENIHAFYKAWFQVYGVADMLQRES